MRSYDSGFMLVVPHLQGSRSCDLSVLKSQLIPQRFQEYLNTVWIEGAVGELESETLGTDTAPPLSLDRRGTVVGLRAAQHVCNS